MNNLSLNYEQRGTVVMQMMRDFYLETTEILRLWYNIVSVDDEFEALGDSDVVAQNRISKKNLVDSVIIAEQIKNFLNNGAISASNYILNVDALLSAGGTATFRNFPIENLANKVGGFIQKVKQAQQESDMLVKLYSGTSLSVAVSAINGYDPGKEVLGCNLDASVFLGGVTLFQNFNGLLTGGSATQGDYMQTVINWKVF